ncbi:SAM-dependent methyltransferase [Saccharothrix sp. NPDC042600]|uniref:SAM-dependent methyltransferase n=1 Tax=Saccharothrix TaxID=2071 RepID=UPI00340849A6|nr:SAM-dependent methyltransferase [Saccharothrix mutabilis subsp. capreolus]
MSDRADRHATDFTSPNAARMHDFLLGGTLNTPVDRAAATAAVARRPELLDLARHHRAFLRRVVHHMVTTGVRQFLDLGSGLPTVHPTHDVARDHHDDLPVVYVDHDPTTVDHGRRILRDTAGTVIEADLLDPDAVLGHPETRRLLDFTRPVGILAIDVLDTCADHDRARAAVDAYIAAGPTGGMVAITHASGQEDPAAGRDERPAALYPVQRTRRSPHRIATWLNRLTLVEPGIVPPWRWRPDEATPRPPERSDVICAVGVVT